MTIWTEAQFRMAQERIAELAGCLEDTPEEAELVALLLAIKVWDTKTGAGAVCLGASIRTAPAPLAASSPAIAA